MSQMTVSQISIQNTTSSGQQRQHWLSEQALAWSGLPVVTIRPTMFLESFFQLAAPTVRARGRIEVPFGRGKTSPVAAADVARVVAAVLADPGPHVGRIYELTGPRSQDMEGVAREYSDALNREVYSSDGRATTTMKEGITTMKKRKSGSMEGKGGDSPSQLIDARIKELSDWRGETLARIRLLIKQADSEVVEEWKWRGVPVWSHAGMICTGETYKNIVKMTFAKGASLQDPSGLFNSSLEGNTRRAIDVHEGEKIDEKALKALFRAAVALNTSGTGARPRTKA